MDGRSLARELIRVRINELTYRKDKLEQIRTNLENILKLQIELLSRIEEDEESCYSMSADLDGGHMVQDGLLSFGVLLEMAVHKLSG
eukprot:jgi/Phyca11/132105/e_gw1.133.16.1